METKMTEIESEYQDTQRSLSDIMCLLNPDGSAKTYSITALTKIPPLRGTGKQFQLHAPGIHWNMRVNWELKNSHTEGNIAGM